MPPHQPLSALLLLLTFLPAPPATAWTDDGHEVAAAIAWASLDPATRRATTDLLLQAPPSSGIPALLPDDASPADAHRRLFLAAATWPDLVKRDDALRGRYDHPGWHYVNHYWRPGPDGSPRPVPELQPAPVNAVERLTTLTARLQDPAAPPAERAVALAWVLHLVADLHQPLHASARLTDHPGEERGDKGGNTFLLHRQRPGAERWSLHAWWDTLLPRARPRRSGEAYRHWVDRVAGEVPAAVPASEPGPAEDFDAWARESLRIAQEQVYDGLERGRRPPAEYRRAAGATAERRLATAGRRLAALLERLSLPTPPTPPPAEPAPSSPRR